MKDILCIIVGLLMTFNAGVWAARDIDVERVTTKLDSLMEAYDYYERFSGTILFGQ